MCQRMRAVVGVGLVAVLLVGAAGVAAGGWGEPRSSPVLGADFRVSGPDATDDDMYAAVAWSGPANKYLVVWVDERNSATRHTDIYGRRVGADGVPVGDDITISGVGATGEEWSPSVVWNGTAGEWLVVWQDGRNPSTTSWDVYGRRVGADGVPVGGDVRISSPNATSAQWTPRVAWNETANQYLVVWQDGRNSSSGRGRDIYGQRVAVNGSRIGGDFRVSGPNAIADDAYPELAWNETANQYLVVWQDGREQVTRNGDIYGRRVGADGSRIGGDFRICGPNAVSQDTNPAVVWNETANQYLVVWQDGRNYLARKYDIYGRRVAADGSRVGGDFRVSGPNATADDMEPAVTWNKTSNQYLAIWADRRNASSGRGLDIYGRLVAADGSRVGLDFRISGSNATADEMEPAVTWNGTANQYLAVWTDFRNGVTRRQDIYGRRMTG